MTAIAPAQLPTLALGTVTDTNDQDGRGRVEVLLTHHQIKVWATVATNSAGAKYGVQMLPRKDEIVVVAFITPEMPIVLGALWTGSAQPHSDHAPVQDRYAIITPAGTSIICDDAGQPKVTVKTPAGNVITVSDESGGKAKIDVQGTSIEVTSSQVTVQASGSVEVNASSVTVNASTMTVNASSATFSGTVTCNTLMASSVVSASYSPGAGNIW